MESLQIFITCHNYVEIEIDNFGEEKKKKCYEKDQPDVGGYLLLQGFARFLSLDRILRKQHKGLKMFTIDACSYHGQWKPIS